MKDMSIFSSRRAYEFAQDDIRLTLLSSQPVVAFLKQAFQFELAGIATPMETFGPVPQTIPPGLVFNYGIAPEPEGSGTAIRLMHIEQRRIVIDLAGPSSAIEGSYTHLQRLLAELRSPEGYPAIGKPILIRDHTEIRATLDVDTSLLAPSQVLRVAEATFAMNPLSRPIVPVLTLRMPTENEYAGGGVPQSETYTLDIRAGTAVSNRIYYSSAPLDSDRHLAFLADIEATLQAKA